MFLKHIKALAANRRGGTAIEYGLIAALVVLGMMGALIQVANSTSGTWNNVNNKVAAATGN